MNLYENYLQSTKDLLGYFGYDHEWIKAVKSYKFIDSYMQNYWINDSSSRAVYFADSIDDLNNGLFSFANGSIHRGKEYTLFVQIKSGMIAYLYLLDNSKEIIENETIK